jgi:hypothetical protein
MMRDNTDDFATTINNRYGGYHVTSNENYDGKEEKDERTARKYLW